MKIKLILKKMKTRRKLCLESEKSCILKLCLILESLNYTVNIWLVIFCFAKVKRFEKSIKFKRKIRFFRALVNYLKIKNNYKIKTNIGKDSKKGMLIRLA